MKKLKKSLNTLSMLSRDDMRQIIGGGYPATCSMVCNMGGPGIAVPGCSQDVYNTVCGHAPYWCGDC